MVTLTRHLDTVCVRVEQNNEAKEGTEKEISVLCVCVTGKE